MPIRTKAKVKGLAIEAGISRNNIRYTSEELAKGSESLAGVTIIKDHQATTDNSIGKVTEQTFADGKQAYNGWVEEDGTGVVQKIKDGRLKVSVGAMVSKLTKEKEEDKVMTAKGIRYIELSTTPTPGIATASITTEEGEISKVSEGFDVKQLGSELSENEIDDILEGLDLDLVQENNRGDLKMAEEEPKSPPEDGKQPEEPKEEPKDAPADAPEDKPEDAPEDKPEDAPEDKPEDAPTDPPKEEKVPNVTVNVDLGEATTLASENKKLKEELKKMKESTEAKTKGIVENKGAQVVADSPDKYGLEFADGCAEMFIIPNEDGSFPSRGE